MNDYVIEKTFVYAVIALSKWLSEEWFPHGIYGNWPPKPPGDLMPKAMAPSLVDADVDLVGVEPPASSSEFPASSSELPASSSGLPGSSSGLPPAALTASKH